MLRYSRNDCHIKPFKMTQSDPANGAHRPARDSWAPVKDTKVASATFDRKVLLNMQESQWTAFDLVNLGLKLYWLFFNYIL